MQVKRTIQDIQTSGEVHVVGHSLLFVPTTQSYILPESPRRGQCVFVFYVFYFHRNVTRSDVLGSYQEAFTLPLKYLHAP